MMRFEIAPERLDPRDVLHSGQGLQLERRTDADPEIGAPNLTGREDGDVVTGGQVLLDEGLLVLGQLVARTREFASRQRSAALARRGGLVGSGRFQSVEAGPYRRCTNMIVAACSTWVW